MGTALKKMVYRNEISDAECRLAETHANWLFDSAKSGNIEPSDQSAAKKIDDGYQGEWSHTEFHLDE